MPDNPKQLSLFSEESETAPLSASSGDTKVIDDSKNLSDVTPKTATRYIPIAMSFDSPAEHTEEVQFGTKLQKEKVSSDSAYETSAETPKKIFKPTEIAAKSAMVINAMKAIKDQNLVVPSIDKIVLNKDSSINKEATAEAKLNSLSSITDGLNKVFNDLSRIASIDKGLEDNIDAEINNKVRQPVYLHFMVGDIVISEFSGFTGDKLTLPTVSQICEKMGPSWNTAQFIGWDSDGIAHTNDDIHAILKKVYPVKFLFDGNLLEIIDIPDGTKTIKAVENNIDHLNLVTPLLVNYSIFCATKIITGDSVINIQPITDKAKRTAIKSVIVVFAVRPSTLGLDISTMSKEEQQRAMIIQKVTVPFGASVDPPSEELLAEHGLQLPFDEYYHWSSDLTCITNNVVIKAESLSAARKSTNLINDLKEMSAEEWLDTGKEMVTHAWNAIKYPALIYMEHKLIKQFESGKLLKTRDFVFLRYHGDLMFYKYTGVKSVIEIPAVVNGMYVKHIHPHAFTQGPFNPLHLFNKHKLFSTEHLSASAGNMTQLILPKTIKYLPANFLYHVNAVELLIVPESVSEVSPNAFAGSSLSEIYFNGVCPKGFCRKGLNADIFVRRKAYKSFFNS